MFGLARLMFIGFVVLTIVYICVSLYSRAVRKGKLAQEWDEEVRTGDRDEFIRQGLEEYSQSFRRKLILLVYIIPVTLVGVIIYVTNFM